MAKQSGCLGIILLAVLALIESCSSDERPGPLRRLRDALRPEQSESIDALCTYQDAPPLLSLHEYNEAGDRVLNHDAGW